ncbi:transcriptional regulator [Phenylobacterium sp. Root77]|uniref:MFS transporter n=1 Tax=unclassified Phenylobacterium TaxID=2640670 RepID=UPI0006F98A77|nr:MULTISPECIES: MFS transporter [unclassified Phenylobacterium]KQW65508.1 transcriptional regulator [Phenylobacterium sp. Root1277]KQW94193.1 transcriptional regulator [Phenylobacterium sp. Root1290]KRC39005.1 transcriptional regulator [Phenylobacterium sp. Root77]
MADAATSHIETARTAAWGAVLSMALCVAMLIASEFMPVSLLTPMAEGLRATEGQTGQAISISGLFAVAASLLITTAAGRLNRKWVMVAMTAFMLLSLVLVAAAPNFAVLMIGRALLGVCIGGFWALAAAVIMRLVPKSDVPRALALMYGGQAIAAAFAAPVGSYLGGLFGWREVFWALTPIVAINLIWHVVALPSLPAEQKQDFRAMLGLLARPYFLRGLAACMLSWGSAFTMFTYLRPFLERVTGVGVTTLSILLLILGCAGFIGTWAAGRFLKGNIAPFLKLPAMVMGGATVGLLLLGFSPIAAGLFMAIWGAMNTLFSVIWMTWMSQNADDAPEAAGSLMVAAIQTSILFGAVVGGVLLDAMSIQATFIGSVLLAVAAIALIGDGRRMLKSQ